MVQKFHFFPPLCFTFFILFMSNFPEKSGNDIDEEKRETLINLFTDAIQVYCDEDSIAKFISDNFNQKYFPSWSCVVGKNFGSYITTQEKTHCIQKIGPFTIEIWKSPSQ